MAILIRYLLDFQSFFALATLSRMEIYQSFILARHGLVYDLSGYVFTYYSLVMVCANLLVLSQVILKAFTEISL
jgi:hypothetical protein